MCREESNEFDDSCDAQGLVIYTAQIAQLLWRQYVGPSEIAAGVQPPGNPIRNKVDVMQMTVPKWRKINTQFIRWAKGTEVLHVKCESAFSIG